MPKLAEKRPIEAQPAISKANSIFFLGFKSREDDSTKT